MHLLFYQVRMFHKNSELETDQKVWEPTIDQLLTYFKDKHPEHQVIIEALASCYLNEAISKRHLAHILGVLYSRTDIEQALAQLRKENRDCIDYFIENVYK